MDMTMEVSYIDARNGQGNCYMKMKINTNQKSILVDI